MELCRRCLAPCACTDKAIPASVLSWERDAWTHLGYIRQAFGNYGPIGTFPPNPPLLPCALSTALECSRCLGLGPYFGYSWSNYHPRSCLGIVCLVTRCIQLAITSKHKGAPASAVLLNYWAPLLQDPRFLATLLSYPAVCSRSTSARSAYAHVVFYPRVEAKDYERPRPFLLTCHPRASVRQVVARARIIKSRKMQGPQLPSPLDTLVPRSVPLRESVFPHSVRYVLRISLVRATGPLRRLQTLPAQMQPALRARRSRFRSVAPRRGQLLAEEASGIPASPSWRVDCIVLSRHGCDTSTGVLGFHELPLHSR